jgi:hypothetical protein
MKTCIAVLTRGYDDINQYQQLIRRNKHIVYHLEDKSIDILIFHEGNIKEDHQTFIKNETPEIKLQFIDISNIAFQPEKKNIVFEEAHDYGLGYRHMCSFWFVNFFDAVKDYDRLLRIDEDCYIDTNINQILSQLDEYTFVCGTFSRDEESVTKGLNRFSLDFMDTHKDLFTFKKSDTKPPAGPYTNVMGFSLNKIRNCHIFQTYKKDVDINNFIYKRRWGDLPLWGEVIHYIFGDNAIKIDRNIKYLHGSHNCYVN